MAKAVNTNASLTKDEAKHRIKLLSRQRPAYFDGKEDLDRPVDTDIEVTGPSHNRKLTLIAGGLGVSWLWVIGHFQHIGPCVVRMGGIGGVGTHEEHRFKGYSRRVLQNSLRWMQQRGYDVSMLYGISGFYPKFGFAPAFPSMIFTVPVKEAERAAAAGKRFRLVDFSAAHLAAVLKMYHANNASRTGVTLRDPAIWRPFRKGIEWRHDTMAKVAVDARGKAVGYLVWDTEVEAAVTEVGFATPAVFPALFGAAAELARSNIRFYLSEDDAFMDWCKPLGLSKSVEHRRDGGPMIRLIDVRRTLAKVSPLLAGRMSGRGTLNLRTNLGSAGLSWSGGEMHVGGLLSRSARTAHLPQWALAQLLYGYMSAASLAAAGTLKADAAAVDLLAEMFPPHAHYQYKADEF